MRKTYVLDTSVFCHDYNCLSVFVDNDVIIPIMTLQELDSLKVRNDITGFNARKSIRTIESYCSGDIQNGIDIENGIRLFIDVKNIKCDKFNCGNKDDSILACVAAHENAIMVSKDVNLRLRAKAFGIPAQDYENDKLKDVEEFYKGYREIELTENIDGFSYEGLNNVKGTIFESLYPNEYVQVTCNAKNYLFRKIGNSLKGLKVPSEVWGIKPRSKEQAFLLDALLDPKIPLVTISGKAGTGKTILTISSALQQCINTKIYKNIKMFKPMAVIPGEDIGYLPGSISDKLAPVMGSFYDALEVLLGDEDVEKALGMYRERIKFEPLTYIRGRSMTNSFLIFDELQNVSSKDVKTIITRIGEGTKVVALGDYNQIDVNYLDISNNGLTHLIEKFKHYDLSAHITLQKGERSSLSELAAEIL